MADGAVETLPIVEKKSDETSTRPVDADNSTKAAPVEAKPPTEKPSEDSTESKDVDAADATAGAAAEEVETDAKPAEAVTNGASKPAKEVKRKSIGGTPGPKGKKLNRKKSVVDIHLNCAPGEMWWARTKGNPPWPAIICDEEMLPDTLLSKRPVSAARADGTIRADFDEGGKSAKDRRFPIMFLGTNEFAWHVNSELRPLQLSEVQEIVDKGPTAKTSKKLWEAYEVALEDSDLAYFKSMLNTHYEGQREEEQKKRDAEEEKQRKKDAAAAKAAEPKTPKAKKEKAKRKSTAALADEDIEMVDAEEEEGEDGKKAKSSNKKKRKQPDTDVEEKPAKTPKLKLKAPKEPTDETAKKTPKAKGKKAAKASDEEQSPKAEEKPVLSEGEQKEKTRKTVLYLRHRLQKGFLARDSEPKEEEMADMADHFKNLEDYTGLEPEIIKSTKIHKVLKAIIKLSTIPKDDEYKFKQRSHDLLGHWNKALAADTGAGAAEDEETKTNGVEHDEKPAASTPPKEKVEETTETKSEPKPDEAAPKDAAVEQSSEEKAPDAVEAVAA